MSVTGIRALLEAAEFLKKEEIAKSGELYTSASKNGNEGVGTSSISKVGEDDSSLASQDFSSIQGEKTAPVQDREAHNKLEKDRRADLKARFEKLQSLVPATKGKKCSNLTILRNASRYIHSQTRLEREYVTRIQHLSQEKSLLDKNLERAWQRLSVLGVDLARVRRKVRSKLAQREKREESISDKDNVDERSHNVGDKSDRNLCGLRGSFKTDSFDCGDEVENHSRSISPSGSLLMPGSAEISSISEDDEGSESTTTASECGSNGLECGEITDEASECGEVVVQEGIVPSQAHTCVSLCPTPISPSVQDASAPSPAVPAAPAAFPLRFAACSMSGSFASTASALSGASEPQSGTSSDSGFSSGINDDASGEVKLPMKKRKLARSLVQDLSASLVQDLSASLVQESCALPRETETQPPPEKKIALSAPGVRPRPEAVENVASSLITTLPSVSASSKLPVVVSSSSSLLSSLTTSSGGGGVTMSPATSLTSSMPLLQRTLTGPRTPPASLVRHLSYESPENLNPNWMNQRIVPVYQLLSGANSNASPPAVAANPSSLPASPPAAAPLPAIIPEKLSLVTHSPVTSILKSAALPQPPPPQLAPLPSPVAPTAAAGAAPNGATHLVLPVIGPNDGLILRNLATAGRQPIVLMPITAGATPATSLVPIQLLSDGVVSSATLVNGKLDHS